MRILYALTCEHAEPRPDGYCDIHGIFHELAATAFPARQDHRMLIVTLEWTEEEVGDQAFRVEMLDTSRSPLMTISGHIEVGPPLEHGVPRRSPMIFPIETMYFETPGTYEFVLHVGDRTHPLCPLHLIEIPEANLDL